MSRSDFTSFDGTMGRDGLHKSRGGGRGALLLTVAIALAVAADTVLLGALHDERLVLLSLAAVIVVIALRRSPQYSVPLAIVMVVWVGVVRRILGGNAGYTANDPLIAAPLLGLIPILFRERHALHARRSLLISLLIISSAIAVAVAALSAVPLPQLARAAAFTVIPLLAVVSLTNDPAVLLRHVDSTVRWSSALAALYGMWQYLAPPVWDVKWLQRVIATTELGGTFGTAQAGEFRLFGPTSSPLAFATILALGILFWISFHGASALKVPVIALLASVLVLTAVRTSVYFLLVAVLMVYLARKGTRAVPSLIVASVFCSAGVLFLLSFNPRAAARFDIVGLSRDTSVQDRTSLLARFSTGVTGFGFGFGSSSEGAIGVDNGYLAAELEMGVLGLILLLAICGLVVYRSLTSRQVPIQVGAALVFLVFSETSAPIFQGDIGLFFWLLLPYVLLQDDWNTNDEFYLAPAMKLERLRTSR